MYRRIREIEGGSKKKRGGQGNKKKRGGMSGRVRERGDLVLKTLAEVCLHVRDGHSVVRSLWSTQRGHHCRQVQLQDLVYCRDSSQ